MSGAGTLYFYKGTTFPIIAPSFGQDEIKKLALEMIMEGLKSKVSKEQQIADYKEQLDNIEETLFLHCNPATAEGMKTASRILGRSENNLYSIWAIDICALLILKAIPDDNDNGIVSWSSGQGGI